MDVRVSDISSFYFCPVKVYLERGLGLREKPQDEPARGSCVHDLYLTFSRIVF